MRRLPKARVSIMLMIAALVVTLPIQMRTASADETALWQALREGRAFAIMRHALAPGVGDPGKFRIDDCTTQRNLSDEGRAQAQRIGDRFRRQGISDAAVYTSLWCRCQQTAALLGLGPVTGLPALNSIFMRSDQREPQTNALRAWLGERQSNKPLVLVTHHVNIAALTGRGTSSGEFIVMQREDDGRFTVLGAIAP